ncbi:hypothetical protein ACLOJK_017046 [Asimina triloba]
MENSGSARPSPSGKGNADDMDSAGGIKSLRELGIALTFPLARSENGRREFKIDELSNRGRKIAVVAASAAAALVFVSRTMAFSSHSNLECFLECTTPTVPSQFLPKTCIRDLNALWQPLDKDTIEYFTLGDLWDRYDEWSAYGAGAPIVLSSGETVVQYYVPYLSAIQIYTSKSYIALRNLREDCDAGEVESDSWSDDSDGGRLSRSLSNNSSRGWDAGSEDSSFEQDGLWPMRDRLGYLYMEYFERSAPYGRIPLMDKVNELSRIYPGLMSLKSVDLSPASWMAVAW